MPGKPDQVRSEEAAQPRRLTACESAKTITREPGSVGMARKMRDGRYAGDRLMPRLA